MSEYGYSSAEDMEKVFKYLKNVDADGTLPYQKEYENLYIDNGFSFAVPDKNEKVWYLTFDDGPNTEVTPKVLDTLKEYGAKATFFVIYRDGEEEKALYKRIVEESHTLGIHSTTHNYTQIYASVESYLENFSKISNHLEEITGLKPEIFRFPGGSVNSYNKSVYQQIIAEMARRGYVYYDLNYSSGDASDPGVSRADITSTVLNGGSDSPKKILLCHDGPGHQNTSIALPEIIEGLSGQGYTFKALDNTVSPVCFGY